MTKRRIFAIGLGEYIEFRIAKEPPKPYTTSVVKKIKEPSWEYIRDPVTGKVRRKRSTKYVDFVMTQTVYTGGRTIGAVNRETFEDLAIFYVDQGDIVELNDRLSELVWRKRNEWV